MGYHRRGISLLFEVTSVVPSFVLFRTMSEYCSACVSRVGLSTK